MSREARPPGTTVRESGRSWPAIAWFLLALPHFAIPAGPTYRPPAASIVLLLWSIVAVLRNRGVRVRTGDADWVRQPLFLFFGYCLLSTAYGYWSLSEANRETLALTTGNLSYLRVAFERILQLFLVIVSFEVVRESRYPAEQLLRWWLNGTLVAAVLHGLTYGLVADPLAHRAGTFNEGNLAGLYYLLSLFLALEYYRAGRSRHRLLYLLAAGGGILMSRSTAAIVLALLLGAGRYALANRHAGKRLLRSSIILVGLPLVALELVARGLDFGIGEKLFEQEVTANSFSRIDRLESIAAAYRLFLDSPVFGNGLQSYGFLSNDLLSGPLQAVYDASYRRIPNNIYLEIAAEMGVVGLALFGLVLWRLLTLAWRYSDRHKLDMFIGLLAVLLYWNAFPTYTVVFIWAYFGFTAMLYRRAGRPGAGPRRRSSAQFSPFLGRGSAGGTSPPTAQPRP